MLRRLAPGALLAVLSAVPGLAFAADAPPSLDEVVRETIQSQMSARSRAEDLTANPSLALSGPIDPATYRLGPGDQLFVRWSGRLSRSDRVDVGPAGDLFLTEIGTVNVADLTLASARQLILDRLQRVTRDVRVEVQLARPRRFRVYLSGSVEQPGPAEAIGGARLSDVLRPEAILAGASRRNVRVRHRDGTEDLADLERVFRTGDHSRDPWLRDGDAVEVPWATEYVRIAGAVAAPGLLERRADDSLATVLRLMGGVKPETANEGAQWIHWSESAAPETLSFDVQAALAGRVGGTLAHGDAVFVRARPGYRQTGQVTVEGDVARPGGYAVATSGTRLSDVVTQAGGFLASADSTAILVVRRADTKEPTDAELARQAKALQRELSLSEYEANRAQESSRRSTMRVDFSRAGRESRTDPLLQDGDVVTVPRLVRSLRVEGQVARPGLVTWAPGLGLNDYIRQAGGHTPQAWGGHEQVTRAGSAQTMLAKGAGEPKPGDFIWVPMRPQVSVWSRAGAVLGGLAQIATVVIAIRSVR